MTLFVKQDFISHSGLPLHWKIECDALTGFDLDALALMLAEVLPPFAGVYGVPRGGVRIAHALGRHLSHESRTCLIVDDVLTTGRSMEEAKLSSPYDRVIGAVLFARGPCPEWITPLFQMPVSR